jgi:hypothetical protein
MNWVTVPNLNELGAQMNERFPSRDKGSDGTIGDAAHQASASSHNPDISGTPEYRDGDSVNEVRARDIDKDLRDPAGVTMEDVVQLWVKLARAGQLWWVRYIIYNKRIWHKRDGYLTRTYTGDNAHTDHVHVNSDFTQSADTVTGTDWRLTSLTGGPVVVPVSHPADNLVVDGELGPKTISRWQRVMGTTVDGHISVPSMLVMTVQRRLRSTVDHYLVVDGVGIAQDNHRYKTVGALQRYLGSPVDEVISSPKSQVIMALQRRLNENRF